MTVKIKETLVLKTIYYDLEDKVYKFDKREYGIEKRTDSFIYLDPFPKEQIYPVPNEFNGDRINPNYLQAICSVRRPYKPTKNNPDMGVIVKIKSKILTEIYHDCLLLGIDEYTLAYIKNSDGTFTNFRQDALYYRLIQATLEKGLESINDRIDAFNSIEK